ncbi:MAG: histidine kinase N-terminal 7TM domain-containing protein [bacterium]|nr:histidine kinase N-terminal 7TM domain-containing protein [bacterium]
MTVLATIILIATLVNLFLVVLALASKPRQKIHYLFSGFFLVFTLWIFANFLLIILPSTFWIKSTYAFGFLAALSALFWIWKICDKKITKTKIIIVSVVAIFAVFACYFLLTVPGHSAEEISNAYEGSIEYSGNQIFFSIYFPSLAGIFIILIATLAFGYKRAKDLQKKQIGYVLIGLSINIFCVAVSNFVFPYLNLYKLTPIFDSPTSLFFSIFSLLAISKYRLLETKVILTEILVVITGLVLLTLPFLMETPVLITTTAVVFGIFCICGYMLVKSAVKESHYKDRLEKEVALRTDDLKIAIIKAEARAEEAEKAKNLAEQRMQEINKRKEELEKFYKLTVGRELKMIELKEKIKKLKDV